MAGNAHPKMDRTRRAKQFMPFDALKGFREALVEKERMVVPRKELPDCQERELDVKLHQIRQSDIVTAEYFRDGEYAQVTGEVTAIDETDRILEIDGMKIPLGDICDLQGGIFATWENA